MVSDLQADTVGLASELWEEFVSRLGDDRREDGLELGRRLIGYRKVSLALVLQLARARGVSPVELMRALGPWLELESLEG